MSKLKETLMSIAGMFGFGQLVAIFLFVVRFPFYEDNLLSFMARAAAITAVILLIAGSLTLILFLVMWAASKSKIVQLLLAAIIVFAVILGFMGPSDPNRCGVVGRYTGCQ